MTQSIRANFEELMDQATGTIDTYMGRAEKFIDGRFGSGYAEKNPVLLSAFILSSAIDFGCATVAQQIRAGLQETAEATSGIGETLGEIDKSLTTIDSTISYI